MRIVSLAPSNTEILYALDAGDEVIATTSLCDYPEEARQKPSIGGWSEGLDAEKVTKMEPDIALASDDLQDSVVEELRERDVNVHQFSPHSLEDVFDSVEEIGRLLKREGEARELLEQMRSRLQELSVEGKRIYCEEWTDPPMVSGNWIPGLIERIDGKYFIDGGRSREFDPADLRDFDPEYIFLNVCGAGENIDPDAILKREGWQGITAVEKANIHVIHDALLNRPGPRLVEGAEKIVEKVED